MDNKLNPPQWVEQYADLLFKFAAGRVGDVETAKDLVQDAFLSAFKNANNFRGEISEKNWLFAILKNKIIEVQIREFFVFSINSWRKYR